MQPNHNPRKRWDKIYKLKAMLNISNNQLNKKIDLTTFKSGAHIFNKNYYKSLNTFLIVFAVLALCVIIG